MKNLASTIKDSFQHINKEMNTLNDYLCLSKGTNGKTLEFYNDEGEKKVFDIHHYNNGQSILFKK